MAYEIKNICWSLNKTVGQTHNIISLSLLCSLLGTTPITHQITWFTMTTAAPITMPQHPLLFAIWQTNITHILVVPLTTMCRSNKVRNINWSFYEYICYSPSHRHRHDGLSAPSTAFHISLSPHSILNGEGQKRYEGEIYFCQLLLLAALNSPRHVSNPPTFRGSTITHPTHHLWSLCCTSLSMIHAYQGKEEWFSTSWFANPGTLSCY
jgi:hypothetical protein